MSQNIYQLYQSNPATNMQSADLLYLGRSPYNVGDDFAITYANFLASVQTNNLVWSVNANASITAAVNNGYILTSGSATTVTLPTVFAAGTMIGITGTVSAWTATIGAATNVQMFGNTYTTSIASANNTDAIILLATVANTTWVPISLFSKGFTVS